MARYKRYGHAMEDGVRTLYFDEQCCHIQGVCEWVACQDVVLSKLSGGTSSEPATGLYVGSDDRSVVVPPAYLGEKSTLLVFMAYNISGVTISHGLASDMSVTVVPTAATNVTGANRTIALGGRFWDLS